MMTMSSALQAEVRVHRGEYLTAVDFPVGALGGSVIRLNGKAERQWWHIFNNFEERQGTGWLPNSFFAIRTEHGDATTVRALQTTAVGPFVAMKELSFRSEYPFGWYGFADDALPVSVQLEAYSFLIPMDLKNSGIPCAIFRYTVKNTSSSDVGVSLLATQQNGVGWTGYDAITGEKSRQCAGYGSNLNRIVTDAQGTTLQMTGAVGSMALSAYGGGVSSTAAWRDLQSLFDDFAADGMLSGDPQAQSPQPQESVDGALAQSIVLAPGSEQALTFVLSWHIPKGSFGRLGSPWYWPEGGCQYENWWSDAMAVDRYVRQNIERLDGLTRKYHSALYASTLPRYVIDRISSNIAVLKSPTSFWTRDGYFGLWESTSNHEEWLGNCKHVYHYAQGHARLFPELGRLLRKQEMKSMTAEGLLPARDCELKNAMDGHFGTILASYREHLLSEDSVFLKTVWPPVQKAMDYAIETYDPDGDGMLSGSYHNTLDCNVSGTSPWIGSLYLAALKASSKMAELMQDTGAAKRYLALFETGRANQDAKLWDEQLGYYKELTENLPMTRVMGDAISIDMFLGQWWANQLDLGQIYPLPRIRQGLEKIFAGNRFVDETGQYPAHFRDFLGKGDTGWQMFAYPGERPENTILYFDEVMSGFEYSMAATLIQYGLIEEGLVVIKAIHDRYDGRLRAKGEVHMANNSTVYGCGSPVGEDECGDFYGRAMSSWSALLALQGFSYDGPAGIIGFKPVWKPEAHRSFFTGAAGWGTFSQTRGADTQANEIQLLHGHLVLNSVVLELPEGVATAQVDVIHNAEAVPYTIETNGREIRIRLATSIKLDAATLPCATLCVRICYR